MAGDAAAARCGAHLGRSVSVSVIRWLGIALLPDHLSGLALLQLLHAASSALGHAVAIQWIDSQLPTAHRSRGQAFYLSFCFGLAGVCGALFTGWLWQDGAGGPLVFMIAAVIAAVALLLGLLLREPIIKPATLTS